MTLATKPLETSRAPLPEDVRARRPYILSGGPLKASARRLGEHRLAARCSTSAGWRSASTPRSRCARSSTGSRPMLWGLIWRDAEAKWLPFLALVTVLVFWRNGLYSEREHRGGLGTIVSSLVLVAVLDARLRDRHRLRLRHVAIFPTALVIDDGADRVPAREL